MPLAHIYTVKFFYKKYPDSGEKFFGKKFSDVAIATGHPLFSCAEYPVTHRESAESFADGHHPHRLPLRFRQRDV